jgi:hypothetical protein
MFPVEVEDRSLLPVFEPMVPGDPTVVFVDLSITLLPTVKSAFWHAHPTEDALSGNLGSILPEMNIIDDAIAYVVGNPNSI